MNPKQMILVGVGVVALCAGIGIAVTSFGTTTTPGPNPDPEDKPEPPIDFPDAPKPQTQEAFTAGHYAFQFKSKVDKATTVGVIRTNCKCASVDICLTPPEWSSLPSDELTKKAEDPSLKWTRLEKDEDGFSIPARAEGLVRVGWKDDKIGNVAFSAELWVFEPRSGVTFTLNVGVMFIEPVKICWAEEPSKVVANVGKLNPGDHRDVQFMIWSCTRKKFSIEDAVLQADPCIKVGAAEPLSAKELETLPKQQEGKALCGYRVPVTVNERVGDSQLDIGPFRRNIAWKTDASAQPVRGAVYGSVTGEVSAFIAGKPDYPRLEMDRIDPDNPVIHTINIESVNPHVELTLDEKSCDILNAKLVEGAKGKDVTLSDGSVRRTWTVQVTYRPDSGFRGPFPDKDRAGYTSADCLIVFKIAHAGVKKEQPRRIRIPVAGQVAN